MLRLGLLGGGLLLLGTATTLLVLLLDTDLLDYAVQAGRACALYAGAAPSHEFVEWGRFRVLWLAVAYNAFGGLALLTMCSVLFREYVTQARLGSHTVAWLEVAASAVALTAQLALMVGVADVFVAVALGVAAGAAIVLGALVPGLVWTQAGADTSPALVGRSDRRPLYSQPVMLAMAFGWLAALGPWLALAAAFAGSVRAGGVPWFVWAAFFGHAGLGLGLGALHGFWTTFTPFRRDDEDLANYHFAAILIAYSVASKTAMTWLVFIGSTIL